MVRELQPGILINDRADFKPGGHLGASVGPDELAGDFSTPEQSIPWYADPHRPWESCMTMNDHWGYNPADTNWKSARQLVRNLVQCTSRNGNYLLNVGPDPDGLIPPEAVARLRQVGRWLRANGEAIYGTEFTGIRNIGPVQTWPTVKGETLYIHAFHWPGREMVLGNIANQVLAVRFVEGDAPIEFRQEGSRVLLTGLPQYAPDEIDTVIAVECDGVPRQCERFE